MNMAFYIKSKLLPFILLWFVFFYVCGKLSAESAGKLRYDNFPVIVSHTDYTADVNYGLYDGVYKHKNIDIKIADGLGISSAFERLHDCSSFRTVNMGFNLHLFESITASVIFFISKFPEYSIEENDLQILVTPQWLSPDRNLPFSLSVSGGLNYRRIKFDEIDYNLTDKMKPLIENFILWQVMSGFKPSKEVMIYLKLGNLNDFRVNNINYWELSPVMIYKIAERLSLMISGGISLVGSLQFAANTGRRWISIGSNYAY
jgi:hypothetical protein